MLIYYFILLCSEFPFFKRKKKKSKIIFSRIGDRCVTKADWQINSEINQARSLQFLLQNLSMFHMHYKNLRDASFNFSLSCPLLLFFFLFSLSCHSFFPLPFYFTSFFSSFISCFSFFLFLLFSFSFFYSPALSPLPLLHLSLPITVCSHENMCSHADRVVS